jgi:hypothetical protein
MQCIVLYDTLNEIFFILQIWILSDLSA